jgi:hypothetical protein
MNLCAESTLRIVAIAIIRNMLKTMKRQAGQHVQQGLDQEIMPDPTDPVTVELLACTAANLLKRTANKLVNLCTLYASGTISYVCFSQPEK